MKVYRIPEKYKFPKGIELQEIKEFHYKCPDFSINSVKGFYIFPRCKDGWYVIDIVNTGPEIIATLGRI